ncbi:hypothetical protein NQ318_016475 [Aromia moschata]|uniref:Uncharacterized protein n=1 Tax=Aromia moschata TaxID=1265417 RepID=A0AAV8Z3Q9_9CUCU|nr:hypothetical protein NQ318_016475 [Aromia moschata]
MNSVDFLLTNKDITYEIRTEIKWLGRPIPDYFQNRLMGGNQSAWTQEGSTAIQSACYESDWIDCHARIRKKLIIIIENSRRPLFLTAGRFSILSLASFATISRAQLYTKWIGSMT